MRFVSTEPGADPIVVEGHLAVSPRRVFEAWTDPKIVTKWFGPEPGSLASASIDLRPGGRWRFVETTDGPLSTSFEGEYLEIVPDELLVFTWIKVTGGRGGRRQETPTSKVEIRFRRARGGTDLRITHSDLDADSRVGFRQGWEGGTTNLAAFLEEAEASRSPTIPR